MQFHARLYIRLAVDVFVSIIETTESASLHTLWTLQQKQEIWELSPFRFPQSSGKQHVLPIKRFVEVAWAFYSELSTFVSPNRTQCY